MQEEARATVDDRAGREPDAHDNAGTGAGKDRAQARRPAEIGGRRGPEPTRYGDWEKNGRCIDF